MMKNQKEFMKWLKDFNHREFMKDSDGDARLYEVYKAIYEQAVEDTEERLQYEFELEREEIEQSAYREGERYGHEEGWDEGYDVGRKEGYEEGYEDGKNSLEQCIRNPIKYCNLQYLIGLYILWDYLKSQNMLKI